MICLKEKLLSKQEEVFSMNHTGYILGFFSALLFWFSFNGFGFALLGAGIPLFYILHTYSLSKREMYLGASTLFLTIGATCWWMIFFSRSLFLLATSYVTLIVGGGIALGMYIRRRCSKKYAPSYRLRWGCS